MAGKTQSKGPAEALAILGLQLSEATFRASETPQERTARIGERGKEGDHRRKVEWLMVRTIVGAVVAVSVVSLALIVWPGRDPDAVKLAFGLLSSVLTGLFGILAGRGMNAGDG